jgi:hypothetical protein
MIKITVKKSKTPRFNIDFLNDELFLKGYKVGFKRKCNEPMWLFIDEWLLEGKFSVKSIAILSDQTEDFVLAIQNRLIQEGKLLQPAKST